MSKYNSDNNDRLNSFILLFGFNYDTYFVILVLNLNNKSDLK